MALFAAFANFIALFLALFRISLALGPARYQAALDFVAALRVLCAFFLQSWCLCLLRYLYSVHFLMAFRQLGAS